MPPKVLLSPPTALLPRRQLPVAELVPCRPQGPRPPPQIRKLTKIRQLGRGAQGVVDLCQNSQAEYVAVKRPVEMASPSSERAIVEEGKVLLMLQHKNIVKLRAISLHESGPKLEIEYVGNGTLMDLLMENGPMTLWEAVPIMHQVLEAMHYMHQQGVVHHDLKPENVLVNMRGGKHMVTLCDFGLARVVGSRHRPSKDRLLSVEKAGGTMAYLPPEVALGRQDYDGKKVDIFSFGLLFYNILTRCYPWRSAAPASNAYRAMYNNEGKFWNMMAAVTKGGRPVNPQLRDLLSKVLDPDPGKRPETELLFEHPIFAHMPRDTPITPPVSPVTPVRSRSSLAEVPLPTHPPL